MKKIMTAAFGLSLLTGTVVFAQNSTDSGSTMTKKSKHKKKGSSKSTDSTGSTTATK